MQGGTGKRMFANRCKELWREMRAGMNGRKFALILVGAMICSFGVHNIHQQTGITEGGVIGFMLLIEHWLGFSPAYITPVLDAACYLLAFRYLGARFIGTSAVSTLSVSLCYKVWELFPPMLPDLSAYPLLAAVLGAAFVGVGVGIIVRQGGSSGGDDALALTISHVTHWRLSRAYLFTDLLVLGLSLTYIPVKKIFFSVITVTLSSFLIDRIQGWRRGKPAQAAEAPDAGEAAESEQART